MHDLLWQLLQLLIHTARDLNEPDEVNAEYVRGQVHLIMDTVGLSGGDNTAYEILTAVITHQMGEIDGLMKIQRLVRP